MGKELVLPALVGQMDFYSDCVMSGESEFPGLMTLLFAQQCPKSSNKKMTLDRGTQMQWIRWGGKHKTTRHHFLFFFLQVLLCFHVSMCSWEILFCMTFHKRHKREKKRHKKVTGKHLFFRCFLFVQLFYLQGKEEKQGFIISHVVEIEVSLFKMFSYKTF